MPIPNTIIELGPDVFSDQRMLVLARELAMDIHPVEEIIARQDISQEEFNTILKNTRFQRLLEDATIAWDGTQNTGERIKVKSLTLLEDWLTSVYEMLHQDKYSLRDKVELARLIGRFAGMGEKGPLEVGSGERINIQINMGADTPPVKAGVVIEHQSMDPV